MSRAPLLLAVAQVVVVMGCGESATVHFAKTVCRQTADTAIVPTAIRAYIDGQDPLPRRFLYIPATDSSPTAAGVLTLQDKGPTYMYTSAPAGQAQVKFQLHSVGDYPSLLLWYHGATRTDDVDAVVTLSGQYVGDVDDGKPTPLTHVAVLCDSTGWHAAAPAKKKASKDAAVAGT
jgi:hypothetical protein